MASQLTVQFPDGSTQRLTISPVISLLNGLIEAGIPIHHRCGGKAQCGTCRIKIVSTGGLSPIQEREAQRLATIRAGTQDRLACQTYLFSDTVISLYPFD
ncbi:MAG: 2Fe-2S iron-sulfur cluster-binding protein [Termitinemataceae bacterium]